MNLRTYLMIKQAAGPRYASDATPEEIAEWTSNELAGQNALKQVSELQSQLDEAIDKNNRYYFDNAKNESNWQDYMVAANEERDKAVADAIRQQQEKYDANEANWQNYMVDAVKEQNRADAKNKGRANTIRRQAAMLADNDTAMARMRNNASIGGFVGGAALGGVGGYAGSNWLSNKLKLTGRKALAVKLLGTAAGSALGGAGGYYLGRNI